MAAIGTGGNFPPETPSVFQKAVSYLFTVLVVAPALTFFMNILNRTRVMGRHNLMGLKPPYLVMSNHLTLLDDLFLGPALFLPQAFRGYRYLPYHAPEERNFYRKALVARFMKMVKSIPVIRGRGVYQEGVNRLIRAVKAGGVLHIYPEGTRSRTGEIGSAKEGVGRIIYETGAPVVPVYHQGLERVLPIGAGIPRIGREIRIAIGKPLFFCEELAMENSPQTWRRLANRVMEAIREQREVMEAQWGFRPVVVEDVSAKSRRRVERPA